jgi:tetratricopeptide (TPR) repeat protein
VAALNAKDYSSAEQVFRQCREREPKNIGCLQGLAETYLAQKMPDQAIHLLEAESAADPANRDLAVALGDIYARTGKWDQALSQFQKVLDATDKQAKAVGELYLRIGETYRGKGDMPSAISALKNARLTLPDDGRVLGTLAMTLEAASSWEAQQAYEDALRVAPNNAILLNNLAFSLAEHGGDLDRALSLARQAQKSAPTVSEFADTIGWIYLKKDMAYEARAAFAPLVQKQPENAAFRGHLATALEWRNESSPALRTLAKALRQEPTEANQRLVLELLKSSGLPVSR